MTSQKTVSAVLLFGICYLVLIVNRPPFLYNPRTSRFRAFGVDDGSGAKSVFSIGFVTCLIAVTSFFVLTLFE